MLLKIKDELYVNCEISMLMKIKDELYVNCEILKEKRIIESKRIRLYNTVEQKRPVTM
jgi:hypothetical protein